MERTDFLKLAHRVSQYDNGVLDIKKNIPQELLVKYNDGVYYPTGYEMKFRNGETLHLAILHELCTNSVVYAPLDKVVGKWN